MNSSSDRSDQEWLRSLGFEDEMIDSLEGTRVIRAIFGGGLDERVERALPASSEVDHGFACVA